MKCTTHDGDQAFVDQNILAVDDARLFSAISLGTTRDVIEVILIRLAEIGRVGIGHRTPLPHPGNSRRCIKTARERNPNTLPNRQIQQYFVHLPCNKNQKKKFNGSDHGKYLI